MGDSTTIALNLTFFGTLGLAFLMFFGLFLLVVATLVLAGVGHAVMPSSWAPTAHKAGLRTLLIEPVSHLDVAILSRKDGLTPAAQAFLKVAEQYVSSVRESPAAQACIG